MANTIVNRVKRHDDSGKTIKPSDVRYALRPLLGSQAKKVRPGDQVEYSRDRLRQLPDNLRKLAFTVLAREV